MGPNSDLRFALRRGLDLVFDGVQAGVGVNRRLDRLAAQTPALDVLVLCIYGGETLARGAVETLSESKHRVSFALGSLDSSPLPGLEQVTLATEMKGDKFANINELLAIRGPSEPPRWTLLIDDDIRFPSRFLDRFLALCEHFDLRLAQPAMSRRSHASYQVTRRRPAALVRQTRFVEGQVTAFRDEAGRELMPFPPDAGMWGLDLHWAGVAADRGWRLGVVDATSVRHEMRPTGQTYAVREAAERGLEFIENHRSLPPEEAERTLAVHRKL